MMNGAVDSHFKSGDQTKKDLHNVKALVISKVSSVIFLCFTK